jgi:hypothetical protein
MDSATIEEEYDILKGRARAKIKRSLISTSVSSPIIKTPVPFSIELYHKDFVIQHGNARYNYNKQTLKNPHKYDLNPNSDIIGVLGELAFEKLTGIPMDKRIGFKDHKDFSIGDLNIDVKGTEKSHYLRIKLRRLSVSPLYYYVFVRVNLTTFAIEFVGCLSGDKIIERGKIWPDDPDWYKINEDYLDDMTVIKNELIVRNAFNGNGHWI